MDISFARDMWRVLEPLHAVTYFAADCRAANKAVGLRGYWMGYFAARSAPFGPASPSLVEATFYNFHPDMIRRAIPDAWTFATPDAVLSARSRSAAAVLRSIVPDIDNVALAALPQMRDAITRAPASGRPLFAANRDLPNHDDPVEALWQAATTLREHRGDGHVACLLAEGIDGCEAHVLFSADTGVPSSIWRENRGWSESDWHAAHQRLADRRLINPAGLTASGRAVRDHLETRTDGLAMGTYRHVSDIAGLLPLLTPAAKAVATSGQIPYPNPMGANPL